MPQDINALLQALKSKEGSSSLPQDEEDDMPDMEAASEDSPEDASEDDSKICALLQDQYPNIYAKLMKQVEAAASDDEPDDASQMDMMQ